MEKKKEVIEVENVEKTAEVEKADTIQISDEVVAVIAGMTVAEVSGVAEMAGGFAGGISEVFSGKKNMAKGIKVEINDKSVVIDVNIIVEYGSRIPDVAFDIQKRIKASVENMTGLNVEQVNVHVQGVSTKILKNEEEDSKENTENGYQSLANLILSDSEEEVEEESSEETSGYQALASLLMSDTDEYEDVEDDTDEE